jgi:hypothetical protein
MTKRDSSRLCWIIWKNYEEEGISNLLDCDEMHLLVFG